MQTRDSKLRHLGNFSLGDGKQIFGELRIRGSKTRLSLNSSEYIPTHNIPINCITGVLLDLSKVSLLDCVTPRAPGHSTGPRGTYYFADVFAHYVTIGDYFVGPKDATIRKITVYLDDAKVLFHDFKAFGIVFEAEPFVKEILQGDPYRDGHATGPNARILYYTGHDEVVSGDTVFGRVLVEHRPDLLSDDHDGGVLRDEIAVSLEFKSAVLFHEAIMRIQTLIEYFGLLVGRPQNLKSMYVATEESIKTSKLLTVYWNMYSKRDGPKERSRPSSHDILIDGVRQPEAFISVLAKWLERHEVWHSARWRFFNSFFEQRHYDVDRLVGAANMFDVLPPTAAPMDNQLSDELVKARIDCRALFAKLPISPERDSVLNCLGRLGKSSLKRKIRYRAQAIIDQAGERFPDLIRISDQAVDCRNFYVHGSEGAFDYERNFDAVIFFTNTLEFIFAISDMIEAGWDFKSWTTEGSSLSHPFGEYKIEYRRNAQKLFALLPRPR